MKKASISLLFFILIYQGILAQQILWQNTIKGSSSDGLTSVCATSDGAVICAGSSNSTASLDKSEPSYGGGDFWIVKLDTAGVIEWDKTIGGADYDYPATICQTPDGGYYCGGTSLSGISGIKTEPNIGLEDFWIIRLDASGNILWQNTIGGDSLDKLNDLIFTPDGGVLCGGVSKSGISGDKTENSIGEDDYWLVKLVSTGAIQWQNTIGGSGRDWMNSLANTQDGGYICGILCED